MAKTGMENAEQQNSLGMSFLRKNHTKVMQEGFGDIVITLWRDNTGNPYVRMERGLPREKTFCIEHFLLFAEKVQKIADACRERIGEI